MPRKFFRTVFQIEVISEDPLANDWGITQLRHQILDGDATGSVDCIRHRQVSPKLAAQLAISQGTDPEFLFLDEDGSEAEGV